MPDSDFPLDVYNFISKSGLSFFALIRWKIDKTKRQATFRRILKNVQGEIPIYIRFGFSLGLYKSSSKSGLSFFCTYPTPKMCFLHRPTPKMCFRHRRRPKCLSDTADAQNVFPTPPTPYFGMGCPNFGMGCPNFESKTPFESEYTNVRMYECTNVRMYECTNVF